MVKEKLHRLEPAVYKYVFGPSEPLSQIKSGDSVIALTIDAHGFDLYGKLLPEDKKQKSEFTK